MCVVHPPQQSVVLRCHPEADHDEGDDDDAGDHDHGGDDGNVSPCKNFDYIGLLHTKSPLDVRGIWRCPRLGSEIFKIVKKKSFFFHDCFSSHKVSELLRKYKDCSQNFLMSSVFHIVCNVSPNECRKC